MDDDWGYPYDSGNHQRFDPRPCCLSDTVHPGRDGVDHFGVSSFWGGCQMVKKNEGHIDSIEVYKQWQNRA